MQTTMTISANLNTNPFEVFEQDVDEVIMLINYYIKLGDKQENNRPSNKNDGFWDF